MKMVYDTYEYCEAASQQINENMGFISPKSWSMPTEINNPEHELYGKWYIDEVLGDEVHHALWMEGIYEKSVEHPEGYILLEYDWDWQLHEEI